MNDRKLTEEKVFSYLGEHHMLEAGDRVIAGVSGGADSVCLLFVLLEYTKKVPFSLVVVHVNHGIRSEAGEDARYVEELCGREGIPFRLVEENVPARAAEWGCSEEEAGRRVRYQAFARAAEEFEADHIAVAHNRNDSAETMLFHLFRGSGLRGLSGIRPVRDRIIRPILCLEREEIEEYLALRGIPFCRDATNEEDDYTRNRIRHHILPYAEREIAAGCVGHMAQTAQLLSETEDYLEEMTREALKTCTVGEPPLFQIVVRKFQKLHVALQRRVLFALTKALSPEQRDITQVHVRELRTLFVEEGNRTVCLPFGIQGRREYDRVILEQTGQCAQGREELSPVQLDIQEKVFLEGKALCVKGFFGEIRVTFLENFDKKLQNIPQNECTKWFDYDKINGSLEMRTRQTGDHLTISDGKGGQVHQSLKDYMITGKIPRQERDRIPVLADGKHILWLFGYRISEHYKISENTKRILQVQLLRSGETEDKDGRACESTVVGGRGRQTDPGDRRPDQQRL
ncbi:MAG: tRNA lysidine(34) synthetase TilS [Acetatifactor sp.]|nr:tRNA lysidine(34) synthetase TilS [Acetatifactor sp.]